MLLGTGWAAVAVAAMGDGEMGDDEIMFLGVLVEWWGSTAWLKRAEFMAVFLWVFVVVFRGRIAVAVVSSEAARAAAEPDWTM